MSFISDLTNSITGGTNGKAEEDLRNALAAIQAVQTPTAAQLQLSPLAQYVSTGELSPAQMQAAAAGPSAYGAENLSSVPMATMQQALAQEGQIANAQGMTPQERAQIAAAEDASNTNTAGQRGAIEQSFAGRGVPQSLISAALQNGAAGQNAQTDYLGALQAQGQAANQGLTALSNEGNLASQMYGQEAGQANTVAAAQNALNQFNAANTQQANAANQTTTQAANTYDTNNAQGISNQNVTGEHQVQIQNQVDAPQEAAKLALQKADALAGVGNAQAKQQTAVGQQDAGVASGLIGAGSNILGSAIMAADGGEIPPQPMVPPINFKAGGGVPGQARVPGNSRDNDTVPAMLSPGEVVLPRTVVKNPGSLGNFLKAKAPDMAGRMAAHPDDLTAMLRALGNLRQGAA
jgi:hypothetical protein